MKPSPIEFPSPYKIVIEWNEYADQPNSIITTVGCFVRLNHLIIDDYTSIMPTSTPIWNTHTNKDHLFLFTSWMQITTSDLGGNFVWGPCLHAWGSNNSARKRKSKFAVIKLFCANKAYQCVFWRSRLFVHFAFFSKLFLNKPSHTRSSNILRKPYKHFLLKFPTKNTLETNI